MAASIGDIVVQAVTESEAVKTVLFGPDGDMSIIWGQTAVEDIEAAMAKPLARLAGQALHDDALVLGAMDAIQQGKEAGETCPLALMRHGLVTMFGVQQVVEGQDNAD